MADWKKLVVSGSTAELSGLTISNAVTASTFVGDGSNLTGINGGIFSETGSIQSTTNDLQVSGSLTVSGSINDPTRTITTFADLFDSVTMVGGVNVVGGDVMTSNDGETIIFDSEEQGKFPLSGSTLFAEEATIDGTITATSFLGDGSQITNVDYTNLNNIPNGILSSSIVTIDPLGNMTVTSLTQTSARRYKKNIIELDSHNIIDQLKPVEFEWRRDGTKDYGFIAEEVDDIDPILTTRNDDGGLEGLKYSKIIPFLVKKVQDQDKEIQELKELIKSGSL